MVVVVVERRYGGLVVVFEKKWKGKNIDGRADRVSVVMRVRMGMVRVYMTMRSARRCGKECASRGSGGWWFLCTFLLFFFLSCLLACWLAGCFFQFPFSPALNSTLRPVPTLTERGI